MQSIIPCVAYEDAPAAIDWLKRAFGFEEKMVVPGEPGAIAHAELRLGDNLIMLGSAKPESFGMFAPRQLNGTTMCFYVIVAEVDQLYERAKAAGAEMVRELHDTDYGSRDFICRDLEGHLWSFGTYNPHSTAEG